MKDDILVRCAKKMSQMGAKYVIIKKAEHGSLFFYEGTVFASPGFPISNPVDPTGAGDSFAGAVIGHMANAGSSSRLQLIRICKGLLTAIKCTISQIIYAKNISRWRISYLT